MTGGDCEMQRAQGGRGTGEMPSPVFGKDDERRPLSLAHGVRPVGGIVGFLEAGVDCGRTEISRSTAPNTVRRRDRRE